MQFKKLNTDTCQHDNVGGVVRRFRIETDFGTFDISETEKGLKINAVGALILVSPDSANVITISTI